MKTPPAPAAAAMEELHESDVLWPNHHHHDDRCCHGHQEQLNGRRAQVHAAAYGGDARRRPASSAPVAIPEPTATRSQCYCREDDDNEASFVPPHVLVARRRCSEERAACSVCVGQGRTLKGRDLQCVRTAVLRMTEFLET